VRCGVDRERTRADLVDGHLRERRPVEPELLRMRGERMVLVQEAPGRLGAVLTTRVARCRGELVRPGRAPGLPVAHPALDRIRTVEPHDLAGVGAQLDALALADEELLAVDAPAQHDRAGALHTV